MTNPKENTDLREKIHSILFEQSLKWPVDSSDVRHNLEQILELVHQARVRASLEALQGFKRYMDLTSQHAFEATYSVLCKRIDDMEYEVKELESKEGE